MAKSSEPKRVSFTTINSMNSLPSIGLLANGPSPAAQKRFGGDLFTEPKPTITTTASTNSKNQKSIRLNLDLSPTDKANYPEINYSMLMRLEEKKRKKLKQKINGATTISTPFEDNDDDVARIAAELEKKYGSAYGRGRGRSKRDDQCDIGLGYDESDSFIDNTDAYDEIIPEEVETIEGGFYINCGALEFKQLNSESIKLKTDEIIKMPTKSRKRILSTSSSSSNDDSNNSSEIESAVTVTTANPKVISNEKNSEKNRNNYDDSESSEATIKSKNKHKKYKNVTSKKSIKQKSTGISLSSSSSPKPTLPAIEEVGSDGSEKDRLPGKISKSVKTTTVKDMLKAKRDNFLKMQGDNNGETLKAMNGELRGIENHSSDESSDSSENNDSSDAETESDNEETSTKSKSKTSKKSISQPTSEESGDKLRTADTILPELEQEVAIHIQTFKEIVKSKNITGKRFQFDDKLTDVFLKIDESLLCIEKAHRSMVFAHLEYHLLLPKNYFVRKAKQLRIKEEKLKSQRALAKLKKAVIEAMPSVIANYEVEIRKYTEIQNAAQSTGSGNSAKMPKKKFPWNSNLRNLLYDVYHTRWTSFPVLCTRKENLENFITTYLKEKVVEVWPSGWMRYEELQKEIEKRKLANKKLKDKKTENVNTASTSSNALKMPSTANSFAKQFEEFTSQNSRSCGNSDNDSVASSNASNTTNLKRKNTTEDLNNKNKVKTTKISNNQAFSNQNTNGVLLISNEMEFLISTTPNMTGSSVAEQSIAATSFRSTNITSTTSGNTFPIQHSDVTKPIAHVIDLDQYNTANDILEKSKELQKATSHMVNPLPIDNTAKVLPTVRKRTSSTDSDGVEFVGVYQAIDNFATNQQLKSKSKKNVQIQNEINNKINSAVNATAALYNNNNNINKKQIATPSSMSSIQSDGNLGALTATTVEDLERLQQLKSKASILTSKEFTQ